MRLSIPPPNTGLGSADSRDSSHITQLTLGKSRPKTETERPPTHLLVGWTAIPLPHALHVGAILGQGIREDSTQPAFTLLRREGAYFMLPGTAAVTVNDMPVTTEVGLKAGDLVLLDNMSAQVIPKVGQKPGFIQKCQH